MVEQERGEAARSLPIRKVMLPLIRHQRGRVIRMAIAAIFGGFAEATILVLIARIAFALTSKDAQVRVSVGPFGTVNVSIAALVWISAGLVIVRMCLQLAYTVMGTRATFSVVERSRSSLVRYYLAAGWPLQSAEREGRLQELLTTYAENSAQAVNNLSLLITNGFNVAALLLTALWINPLASVGAAAAALAIGLLLRPLRAAVRRRSKRAALANLDFATGVTELTSTLQEVRIFGVGGAIGQRLDELNQRHIRRGLQTWYASGAINVLYQGLALLLMVGALGIAYAAGVSRLASLGAIVLIMLRSLSYAQAVQTSLQGLYQAAPYVEALDLERDRYAASAMAHGGEPVAAVGSIVFDQVSFAYKPGVPVLTDLSFCIDQGSIIGIVGPSGSGKSTLVQLLLRLREPTTGRISTDGRDVTRLAIDEWYEHVSFVPQEPRLFAGTVADNIRFFRDGLDDRAIENAAKLAHVHDDILGWPQGYDTPVGERGAQLSGGQRQRLCIARALAESPDVLVLDEPTSSLDVRSESLIRATLADLAPQTTVLVIAHRLSTLAICDRIMVILGGVMEGFDEPQTLESSNPFYREALELSGMR